MGDFQANFKRPDAGIRTVEGNVAGSRAAQFERKRQLDQEAFLARKQQISNSQRAPALLDSKFAGGTTKDTAVETIGLLSAEEFKAIEEKRSQPVEQEVITETEEERKLREKKEKKERKKKKNLKKKMLSTLSFGQEFDDDDNNFDDNAEPPTRLVKKDPSVDTSFLPDRHREEEAEKEKKRLEKEWKEKQEAMKQQHLEIIYSYWDGSGHRRNVVCKKGDTIGDFLEQVRLDLAKEFKELANISADALIYVKEDLIIPQDMTFYDLIATKARGKSGPLFHFDVHDDVRIGAIDSRVEKDESHPGKVVERRWYERNKHIFPASRWEVYDPRKEYGKYTIGGGIVNRKEK
ncbi:protein FAM50 [Fistulifera solaris]|uniref:Protein FAM50 n=1 Tax=Fistulifera solaris TaxID=1519565 RepID=A0A1Z5JTH6_FISSO|nr:protein FAM50 [Fistulifera solaris]|eukprot:GAX17088.1 protein FAM50 [Fistulifera solaris]